MGRPATEAPAWARELVRWTLVVGFVVAGLVLIADPASATDDAYISFRYADMWVRGEGLVFNPGERVEGYSNFLWVVVAAGVRAVTGGVEAIRYIELGIAALGLVLVFDGVARASDGGRAPLWGRAGGAALLGVNTAYLFWVGKGMETTLYAVLVLAFGLLALRVHTRGEARPLDGVALGLLAAATALTRPEGLAAPAVVLVALALAHRDSRRPYVLALFLLGAVVGLQVVVRVAYYGDVFPNTYHAKHFPPDYALGAGLAYLSAFVMGDGGLGAASVLRQLPVWLLCAASVVGIGLRARALWPLLLQAVILVGVAVAVGGDWMPAHRFLLPVVPLGCVLVAAGWVALARSDELPRWGPPAALVLLVLAQLWATVDAVRSQPFARWRVHLTNYEAPARWLEEHAAPGALVALSDVGILSYRHPDKRFLDVLGLTDRHIAVQPGIHFEKTDLDYVLDREPDVVVAMENVWPATGRRIPKSGFDQQFFERIAQDRSYVRVADLQGWREGEQAKREVRFAIYTRVR